MWSGTAIQSADFIVHVNAVRSRKVTPTSPRSGERKVIDKLTQCTGDGLRRRHQSWYRIESILVNS